MSDRLPNIPTPSAHLFRQLRLQYLPVVVFVAGIIAAIFLWTRWVAPPTLVGEAESVHTQLRSIQAGQLAELNIDLLQPVRAGETMARVIVSNPQVLESSLAVVRAEINVLRTSTDMNFERLRLDWMGKKVELVALQGQLHQAEATLTRVAALQRLKLVTDEEFDEARNTRDGLDAQIKAQTELVGRLEPQLRPVSVSNSRTVPTAAAEGLLAAIKQKEEQLRLIEAQLSPVLLVAPIDGVVTAVYRRSGENVAAGEPIVQISAVRTDRIIGFLRPPLPADPKLGTEVEVRTRTFLRQTGTARVAQVGQQMEPIPATLLSAMRLPITAVPTDLGLRVHLNALQGLVLRPGEQVDIIIRN